MSVTCGTDTKTVGYVVKSTVGNGYAEFSGESRWCSNNPTVFPSVEEAITAIAKAGHNRWVTIEKVVEKTYTETKTSYEPL